MLAFRAIDVIWQNWAEKEKHWRQLSGNCTAVGANFHFHLHCICWKKVQTIFQSYLIFSTKSSTVLMYLYLFGPFTFLICLIRRIINIVQMNLHEIVGKIVMLVVFVECIFQWIFQGTSWIHHDNNNPHHEAYYCYIVRLCPDVIVSIFNSI